MSSSKNPKSIAEIAEILDATVKKLTFSFQGLAKKTGYAFLQDGKEILTLEPRFDRSGWKIRYNGKVLFSENMIDAKAKVFKNYGLNASYYANYKKQVNGHNITWNKGTYKYDIADANQQVKGSRQTEPDAIKFANSLNRPTIKKRTMSTTRKKSTRTASRPAAAKKPARKKSPTLKKVCSRVIKREGITSDGKLKPGYRWRKGGGSAIKVKAKAPAKKKAPKKGLGRVPVCQRRNPDNSTTQYSQQGGSNPCPYGGRLTGTAMVFDTKARAQKYADDKNKTARTYRYTVTLYPVSKGGNGKAHIVRKVKK